MRRDGWPERPEDDARFAAVEHFIAFYAERIDHGVSETAFYVGKHGNEIHGFEKGVLRAPVRASATALAQRVALNGIRAR